MNIRIALVAFDSFHPQTFVALIDFRMIRQILQQLSDFFLRQESFEVCFGGIVRKRFARRELVSRLDHFHKRKRVKVAAPRKRGFVPLVTGCAHRWVGTINYLTSVFG